MPRPEKFNIENFEKALSGANLKKMTAQDFNTFVLAYGLLLIAKELWEVNSNLETLTSCVSTFESSAFLVRQG